VDAAAVMGSPVETWLLVEVADAAPAHLDECVAAGMLRGQADGVGFRQELAWLTVERAVGPGREAELHGRVLAALLARPGAAPDPAVPTRVDIGRRVPLGGWRRARRPRVLAEGLSPIVGGVPVEPGHGTLGVGRQRRRDGQGQGVLGRWPMVSETAEPGGTTVPCAGFWLTTWPIQLQE
jgi:hypothetical protein